MAVLSPPLVLEAAGGYSGKYLFMCKWTRARQEILEILFTPHVCTSSVKFCVSN